MYDIDKIRHDFPILDTEVYGHKLVYLDNAATTQKPRCVVDAIEQEYFTSNANVHRGVHYLSEKATDLLENARDTVRRFIGAAKTSEIIFTRGTTESINLVASSYGQLLKEGDEILVSEMEHHSDIVPWQLLRDRCGIVIKVIPITDEGELRLDALERLFTPRTRLVCVTQVSNVLGTINPVKEIAAMAHAHGALCLVDGAQSVPHMPVNVKELGCDFFAFSGHKVYGPTGIGVLWGREDLLDRMPPYQAGGEMIASVTFDKTTFEELPFKFEAGTPNYIGSHALAVALDYVSHIGMDAVQSYEADLTRYAMETLGAIDGIRIFGTAPHKDAVVSFLVANIHHLDMGTLLDRLGIAVRTGHHCAQPLMERLGVEGTVRASLALYNTRAEIDALAQGIDRVRQMF
ncbi:MAG: cysteine desulfurase [Prevotellaceae bacterium]|nr:cysteine desulfurase [Prevotellaceae bacterium]MDY3856782.1 cysteine desulfurase [Bacteroidaceae bacterium]